MSLRRRSAATVAAVILQLAVASVLAAQPAEVICDHRIPETATIHFGTGTQDGNRYIDGSGDLLAGGPEVVPLSRRPRWLTGAAVADGPMDQLGDDLVRAYLTV